MLSQDSPDILGDAGLGVGDTVVAIESHGTADSGPESGLFDGIEDDSSGGVDEKPVGPCSSSLMTRF